MITRLLYMVTKNYSTYCSDEKFNHYAESGVEVSRRTTVCNPGLQVFKVLQLTSLTTRSA